MSVNGVVNNFQVESKDFRIHSIRKSKIHLENFNNQDKKTTHQSKNVFFFKE